MTFARPPTHKISSAEELICGRYVNMSCAGGGSVSSETGWDGRKKDEENEDFRLRFGFMQQRPSRLRDTCRQRGKGMTFDVLPSS